MTVETYLRKKLGLSDTDSIIAPRALVNTWMQWYRGNVPSVHRTNVQADKGSRPVQARTLGMAQKVCEDWAGFVINQQTEISTVTEELRDLLVGSDPAGTGGVLGASDFWALAPQAIELGFAIGTAVVTVRLDASGGIAVEFVPFSSFYPISWDRGRITECLILTERVEAGVPLTYYTTHRLVDGLYVVDSIAYDKQDEVVDRITFESASDVPLFSVFTPNKGNNTRFPSMPYGVSIYSGREGILYAIDSLFDMICGDVEVAGIRVLMTKSAVQVEERGDGRSVDLTALDAKARQLLTTIGESAYGEGGIFREFNPTLQLPTQLQAMENYMAILGDQVGLGAEKYTFTADTLSASTATAVRVASADQLRSIAKHRLKAEVFVSGIIRAVVLLDHYRKGRGALTMADFITREELSLSIRFDESFFLDRAEVMKNDLALVQAGVMTKRNFLLRYNLATKENVDDYLAELKTDAPMMLGGMY